MTSQNRSGNKSSHNRTFGLTMAGVLGTIAVVRYVWSGALSWWLIGLGLIFMIAGLLAPAWLGPVRAAWMKFAAVLGLVNARVLMTLVFAVIIVPIGLLLRLLGRQPIPIAADGEAGSYWRQRHEGDFSPSRMERQF